MAVQEKTGVVLQSHEVILRPLVTEKGTFLSERYNLYTFAVNRLANKGDIKKAVEDLWDVRVTKVRTQNRKGKPRRYKRNFGRTKDWKKAIVELHEEDRISFF
ncbi:LSU ribosomal protein L23p (L23Ae) [hydrothermal vent metagenome]|uniref:LSU ribosomal protein L23p (L23Ae) n=1 Tax=hydrothermal vent metagenome TaxID=652676 RepID=A0A3B1E3P5_9ZZZZ